MFFLRFCALIICAGFLAIALGLIDKEILKKDLYKVLRLNRRASITEIKKAFKQLAKRYHPDKSPNAEKAANAEIFRQLSEAYEILSDANLKAEYDEYWRVVNKKSTQTKPSTSHKPNNKGMDGVDISSWFSDYFESAIPPNIPDTRSSPMFARQYINQGDVILPLAYFLVSYDNSYFTYLDMECRLGVYKGDVIKFAKHIRKSPNRAPHPEDIGIPHVFRTPPYSSLKGKCFAEIQYGDLLVLSGSPSMLVNSNRVLWKSIKTLQPVEDDYYMRPNYFVVELSNQGDLFLLKVLPGETHAKCYWSSTSCHPVLATVKRAQVSLALIIENQINRALLFKALENASQMIVNMIAQIRRRLLKYLDKIRVRTEVVTRQMRASNLWKHSQYCIVKLKKEVKRIWEKTLERYNS